MSDISRTWTSRHKNHVVGFGLLALRAVSLRRTFHSGALHLPEERPLVEEFPPEQLSSSEHPSSPDLCLSPRVQTGLDLLQPPGPNQLLNLLVHRADQILQEDQGLVEGLRLRLIAWTQSQGHAVIRDPSESSLDQYSPEITFSVVKDSLDEDRVLCESLRHQQDALLNAMTT